MFDLGWSEMLIIAVVAIIVVGPKDLPRMLRTIGKFVGQAKRMASEFTSQFNDAVRDSELDDLRKDLNEVTKVDPLEDLRRTMNHDIGAIDRDLQETISDYDRADEAEAAAFQSKAAAANENDATDPAAAPSHVADDTVPNDDAADLVQSEPPLKTAAEKAGA
ncbi:MAG: Sec-independent protein translocase protein TatB [Pseudomonadota bacterium]